MAPKSDEVFNVHMHYIDERFSEIRGDIKEMRADINERLTMIEQNGCVQGSVNAQAIKELRETQQTDAKKAGGVWGSIAAGIAIIITVVADWLYKKVGG